ncbi:MAG: hypothetical protein NDJ94_07340 [Vicinamibacteria bacterium]|jgi:hypothetical protein|nr:hypothetical protein [Vicinamibacteria bacterium]
MVETNGWTQDKANEKLRELAKRAQTDMEFRKLALADPVAAIAKIDPTPLPKWFKVRFVDNAGATLTVVLPDPPSQSSELSDAELEQVAGGGDANRCGGSCVVSCGISAIV